MMGEPTLDELSRAGMVLGNLSVDVPDKVTDLEIVVQLMDRLWRRNLALEAERDALKQALTGLLDCYTGLVNSGDAGFWDPEKEPPVIAARAALAPSPDPEHTEIASEMGSGEHLPGWVEGDTP